MFVRQPLAGSAPITLRSPRTVNRRLRCLLVDRDVGLHATYRVILDPHVSIVSAFSTEEALCALREDSVDWALVRQQAGIEADAIRADIARAWRAGVPLALELVQVPVPISTLLRRWTPQRLVTEATRCRLDEAVTHVRTSFPEASTKSVAASMGLSSRQLRRTLQDTLGRPLAPLLLCIRVEAAALILPRTTAPLERVAELTGFVDAAYLSRCFRRVIGCRPGVYRRWTHLHGTTVDHWPRTARRPPHPALSPVGRGGGGL